MSAASICISTFLACLVGGFVPLSSSEVILLSAASLAPPHLLLPLALIAAGAQMLAKSVLYFAGSGLLKLPRGRADRALQTALARAQRWQHAGTLTLLVSATTGFPPFYLFTVASGALGFPFGRFLLVGLCGRVIRFSALVLLPRALNSVF